ncbi:hypothetical protein N431DRAFT_465295 [Stipitochalara longipes BDJ]|nr:hypothetical protein N431DRAFT_465295 [Stipitochalara longipes BDJ]
MKKQGRQGKQRKQSMSLSMTASPVPNIQPMIAPAYPTLEESSNSGESPPPVQTQNPTFRPEILYPRRFVAGDFVFQDADSYWNVNVCCLVPFEGEPWQIIPLDSAREVTTKSKSRGEAENPKPRQHRSDKHWSHEQLVTELEKAIVKLIFVAEFKLLPPMGKQKKTLPGTRLESYLPTRQLQRVFQSQEAMEKFWQSMAQCARSTKTEVWTSSSLALVHLIKAMGRWPTADITDSQRLANWRREAESEAIMTKCFSNVSESFDIAQLFKPEITGNEAAKEWLTQIFTC